MPRYTLAVSDEDDEHGRLLAREAGSDLKAFANLVYHEGVLSRWRRRIKQQQHTTEEPLESVA